MAEAYGGESTKGYSWGTGKTRAWVEGTVSNRSDTISTVRVRGQIQSVAPYYMRYYGARVHAGVYDSGSSGPWRSASAATWLYDADWSPNSPVTGSWDFPRRSYAYSVTVFTYYYGETVSGYGAMSNSGEVQLSVTIPALPVYAPMAVTGIGASRATDYQTNVRWTNSIDSTHPYTGLLVERSVDFGAWAQVASLGPSATSYSDTSTAPGHVYQYRVRAQNSAGYSAYSTTDYSYNTPPPCSNCVNTRNSDTKNTVSWTPGTGVPGLYSSILVERSIDGGSWSQIASVAGSARSYVDGGCSHNHYYRYRVRAQNPAGYSGYAESGYTYNTPAAPASITASRKTETTVTLSISNPAATATALELQRSSDKVGWATIRTIAGTVVSCDDNPGGGTWYYRARNTRGSLASGWSPASNAVVTIIAPAAPTPVEPASGVTLSKALDPISFRWKHNPIDGSRQTAAQLQTSTDGGATWTTAQVDGDAQELAIGNYFSVNSTVTWRVRTKGAHADYGSYSANRVFTVAQEPSVSFGSPPDGFVVENTPIDIELDYSDSSGTLAAAMLRIVHDGDAVYELDMGTATVAEIPASEFLPVNGERYTFTVDVRSTSTLEASAFRDVSVDFVPPMDGDLLLEPDPDTGYVSIMATVVQDDGKVEAKSLAVYRVSGGRRKLLAESIQSGASIMDRYAPLNTDYAYEVVTFADSGIYATVSVPARIDTRYLFFYWGDSIARLKWNAGESKSYKRPLRKTVVYAGRRYPVSYDSDNLSDERTVSGILYGRDEVQAFEAFMEEGGTGVYKSLLGDVFHCNADVSITEDAVSLTGSSKVSAKIERIDGDDL